MVLLLRCVQPRSTSIRRSRMICASAPGSTSVYGATEPCTLPTMRTNCTSSKPTPRGLRPRAFVTNCSIAGQRSNVNPSSSLFIAGEAQVDNRRLGRALLAACDRLGVRVVESDAPIAVEADRRVRGLRTAAGFVATPIVVNAAGAWAGDIAGVPEHVRVPVSPVAGQMLAISLPRTLVRHVLWARGVYLVPRSDGRLLVGATVEHRGFDARVTAAGIAWLLHGALETAPSLGDFTVSETWAGVRPGTPDGLPFLGATAVDGYFVAAGHYRNGILLTPVTAEILADTIEAKPARFELAPFSPDRSAYTEPVPVTANYPER